MVKTEKVELTSRVILEGEEKQVGDVVEVDSDRAAWLVSVGSAKPWKEKASSTRKVT